MVTNTAATRVAGSLKKRIIRDIVLSLGIGIPGAYLWWHTYHVANAKKRDEWYINYAQRKAEAEDA